MQNDCKVIFVQSKIFGPKQGQGTKYILTRLILEGGFTRGEPFVPFVATLDTFG